MILKLVSTIRNLSKGCCETVVSKIDVSENEVLPLVPVCCWRKVWSNDVMKNFYLFSFKPTRPISLKSLSMVIMLSLLSLILYFYKRIKNLSYKAGFCKSEVENELKQFNYFSVAWLCVLDVMEQNVLHLRSSVHQNVLKPKHCQLIISLIFHLYVFALN